ncbi:MAG: hypothetical protein WD929_07630 [Steroidobacteraceae bacterium]
MISSETFSPRGDRRGGTALTDARGTLIRFDEIDVALAPAPTDERLRQVIEAVAAALGLSHRRMPSGAGHDAQDMAHSARDRPECARGVIWWARQGSKL